MFRILMRNAQVHMRKAQRAPRRKFSEKKPTEDVSDAEKAAVVNKSIGSWFKRYGIIIVPAAIFTVVSVDMLNVVSHRDWMEKQFPSYIELLRKHYGFSDEDPAQRQKMRSLAHYYSKPVKMQIKHNHSKTVIEVPSGLTNLEEFLLQDEVAKSFFLSTKDIYCTDSISFLDEEGEEEESEFSKEQHPSDPRDAQPDQFLRCDLVSAGSPFINSLWTSDILTKRADISSYFLYYSKYENVCAQFYRGLREYSEFSSFLFQPVKSANRDAARDRKKKFNDLQFAREMALEKIKKLEHEVSLLNDEKRMGRRSIDAIDADVKQRENQITNLRRAYVNYFYFF